MDRLDSREKMPAGFAAYHSNNGWHFNKSLCEYAVSCMEKEDSNGKKVKVTPLIKEQVESLLKSSGIELKNNTGYDACYVANMAKADYWGSSITNEQQLAKFIKDYLDDSDGYEGIALTRYYADCIGSGKPLFWDEFI